MTTTHHEQPTPSTRGKEPCGELWINCVCMYTDDEIALREEAGTASARGRRSTAPRAQSVDVHAAALAVWGPEEVASNDVTTEALEGATRPQEGHEQMATATKQAKKKATKKATTKAAPEATATTNDDATEAKPDKRKDASARRGRGELEKLVLGVTDAFDEGKIDLDGKTLTPSRIATIIGEKPGEDTPSAGAVAAILTRWDEMGYALTHPKPYAYKRASAAGKKKGLEALKTDFAEKKKAERKAAREAEAS